MSDDEPQDDELVKTHADASRRLEVDCDFSGAAKEAKK